MVTLPFFVCEVPHTRWKNKALGAGVGRGVGENEMADVATALVESSLAVCTCSLLHLLTTGFGTISQWSGMSAAGESGQWAVGGERRL